jgi:hypothetical protein
LGCRQYADRLGERGYTIGKTTVQKRLVDHGLGAESNASPVPPRSPQRRPSCPAKRPVTPPATPSVFIDHVVRSFRRLGVPVGAVLTDNGPEWIVGGFRAHLAASGLEHHRAPPRSPNHNAVCERFQRTAPQECRRPAFDRRRFTSIRHSKPKPTPR